MTTHPTRADWWREVTDPDEVIPKGCPVRLESREDAREHRATHGWSRAEFSAAARVFIDSRWQPPKPAYKAGDVIEECIDATLPADGVGIVDAFGGVGQMDGRSIRWAYGDDVTWWSDVAEKCLPLTVIYVPKAGGDDD